MDSTNLGNTASASAPASTRDLEQAANFVIINTINGRGDESFAALNESTTHVHIRGFPYIWALEEILQKATGLEVIRVIPALEKMMGEQHRALCHLQNVKLIAGHIDPRRVWKKMENRTQSYQSRRAFLLGLEGKEKDLFEEMLRRKFEIALITSRYFCLQGEEYVSQTDVASLFGHSGTHNRLISAKISAMLHILSPSFEVIETSKQIAKTTVEKLSSLLEREQAGECRRVFEERLLKEYGVSLSPKFPISFMGVLEKVLIAKRLGMLDVLFSNDQKSWRVLVLRLGLDQADMPLIHRSHSQIGAVVGVTRERVRQREKRALQFLGISGSVQNHNNELSCNI